MPLPFSFSLPSPLLCQRHQSAQLGKSCLCVTTPERHGLFELKVLHLPSILLSLFAFFPSSSPPIPQNHGSGDFNPSCNLPSLVCISIILSMIPALPLRLGHGVILPSPTALLGAFSFPSPFPFPLSSLLFASHPPFLP